MKSKTSFCNATILRTDVTRFAPVWILYTVGFLLFQLVFLGKCETAFAIARYMQGLLPIMVAINGLYGLLVALVLFSDLLNPRLCNSIHAMPLTRDDFFCTHVFAGFCFSLIPNALVVLASLPLLGKAAPMAMYLFVMAVGTYILYFGTALLAIQLAGNWIAAVLIYGIEHFVSLLVVWFTRYLYEPLLYGVEIPIRNTIWKLCPTISLMDKRYVQLIARNLTQSDYMPELVAIKRANGWAELGIWVVVGLMAMAAAQILYRRRKLETAGDLLAHKKLEPVFMVLFALTVGGFFHVVSVGVLNSAGSYVFLAAGIIVGWFVGRMLLMRQVNVFRWKTLVPLTGILAVMGISVLACVLDIGGVVNKTPRPDQLEHVEIRIKNYELDFAILREPEEMETVRQMQLRALEEYNRQSLRRKLSGMDRNLSDDRYVEGLMRFCLRDGSVVERTYYIPVESQDGKTIERYLSRPEAVFGVEVKTPAELLDKVQGIEVFGSVRQESPVPEEQWPELLDAMFADCAQGTMNKIWMFHPGEPGAGNFLFQMGMEPSQDNSMQWVLYQGESANSARHYVPIRLCNIHTVQWMLEHGSMDEAAIGQALLSWQMEIQRSGQEEPEAFRQAMALWQDYIQYAGPLG